MQAPHSHDQGQLAGGLHGSIPCPSHQAALHPVCLLVMTSTITPAPNAGVKRADPFLRLEDYKRALRFWLAYPHPCAGRILFVENSGADLSPLRQISQNENPLSKPVEFLSIPGNNIPAGTNYGFTEMEMLDHGLLKSHLRLETTHMIKATGRLTFPTVGPALDRLPLPWEAMVECRKLGFPRRGYDAYTQLFACSHSFYDQVLRDSRFEMNSTDVRLLEHLLYRKVAPYRGKPGVHLRFPVNIDPLGFSGFHSRSYNTPGAAFTSRLRSLLRLIAPDYWF